jgi:hypothetical protein
VLWYLREAEEELTRTIREMELDHNYSEAELRVAMTQIYYHINTAWNVRHAPAERVEARSESDFQRWRQFPADLDMSA